MLSVAMLPGPPLVEVTLPVVLFFNPIVVPVTVTFKVQLPFAAIVAPLKLIVPGEVVVSVPPQGVLEPFTTVNPAGSVSLKATPVRAAVFTTGLTRVKLRVVIPFNEIVAAPKLLLMLGGATTVRLSLAVLPVPPLVEVT